MTHIPSIRRNVIGLPVPPMNRDEVRELIKIGEIISGLAFEDGAVEDVIQISNGSPYLASLLAQHAALAAAERSAPKVSRIDARVAVERTLEEVRVRMPPTSLYFIDKIRAAGGSPLLAMLAKASLEHGGRIELDNSTRLQISQLRSGSGSLGAETPLSKLIEPIPEDPAQAYRFSEEGSAVYLWIEDARNKLNA
jgi:hypothetical protein